MDPQVGDKVYRAETLHVMRDAVDLGGIFMDLGPEMEVVIEAYEVTKLTPRGFWIGPYFYREKWCSFDTRFVEGTPEDALRALMKRKDAYVKHSQRRLQEAKSSYQAAVDAWLHHHNEGESHELRHDSEG